MANLDYFTSVIFNKKTPTLLNVDRWFKLNDVNYFVIQKFTTDTSSKISSGLNNPDTFHFTNNGNIYIKNEILTINTSKFYNPVTTTSNNLDNLHNSSLKYYTDLYKNIYKYNNKNIISLNLLWILHKDDLNIWRLLYNPIHSKNFKEYYISEYNKPNSNNLYGLPVQVGTSLDFNYSLNTTYANSLKCTDGNNTFFLDPTIMILDNNNAGNAFIFDDNIADRRSDILNNTGIINQLKSIGDKCYCPQKTSFLKYIHNVLPTINNNSFVITLLNNLKPSVSTCIPPITFNNTVCKTIIASAHDTNTSNSTIQNNCSAGNTPAPANDTTNTPAPANDTTNTPAPADDTTNTPAPADDTTNTPDPEGKKNKINIYLIIVPIILMLCIALFLFYIKNKKK